MSHTPATKSRFLTLRAKGYSYLAIAKKLNVSRYTLLRWAKDLAPQLAVEQALELEHRQHRVGASKTRRTQILGQHLRRLHQQLKTRDLSDLPTEKLLSLTLRYAAALAKDESDPAVDLQNQPIPDFEDQTTPPNEKNAPGPDPETTAQPQSATSDPSPTATPEIVTQTPPEFHKNATKKPPEHHLQMPLFQTRFYPKKTTLPPLYKPKNLPFKPRYRPPYR